MSFILTGGAAKEHELPGLHGEMRGSPYNLPSLGMGREIGGVCCGESPEPLAGEHGGEGPRFLFHLRSYSAALPHGVYLRLAWPTVCRPPVTIQSLIGSVTASEKHVTCHKVPRCTKAWDLGRQAVREQ